ncbi:hypothetical protein Tco_0070177, partial [Tanacetum coccineum]
LSLRDQRHQYLRFEGLQYTEGDIADFETRLARIYRREGQSVFASRAWRRLLDIRGPLVHELILEFFGTFRFRDAMLDLDTAGALQFQLGGVRRRMSWREFILTLGLHLAEEMQTVVFGFSGYTPSYTLIRDPMLRLCHRLIACSIAGRSQAPKKVTVIDLFYLRGMDVGSVNVPYLLARLQICVELDDTWAWVAPRPERQPDATTGAPEDALIADVGAPGCSSTRVGTSAATTYSR